MKTLLVYGSKYGSSKQYAMWLAEETGATLYSIEKIQETPLQNYDLIVYGGGVYASSIHGFSEFKKAWEATANQKKLAVFAVGVTPEERTSCDEIRKINLTSSMQEFPLFYLRGAMDRKRLSFAHRCMISMISKATKKSGGIVDGDWKTKEALTPILEWMKSQMQ